MNEAKKKRLESNGWKVGTVAEFFEKKHSLLFECSKCPSTIEASTSKELWNAGWRSPNRTLKCPNCRK